VGTSSVTYPANVFVYNPDQALRITVTHQTAAGVGAFNVVPAKGVYRFAMPLNSGAYFYAGDGRPFLAVGTMDSTTNSANNQTFDWGYTLVPDEWLTTAFGWAGRPAPAAAARAAPAMAVQSGSPLSTPLLSM
jgi:hypothetical protein